jgi:hypothetical protein
MIHYAKIGVSELSGSAQSIVRAGDSSIKKCIHWLDVVRMSETTTENPTWLRGGLFTWKHCVKATRWERTEGRRERGHRRREDEVTVTCFVLRRLNS